MAGFTCPALRSISDCQSNARRRKASCFFLFNSFSLYIGNPVLSRNINSLRRGVNSAVFSKKQFKLLTSCIRLDTLMCMHKRLDIAEYLDSEEIVAEYLNLVSESDDPALFLRAIGHIARSKGMSQIAEKTGLGRESLYKALDEKAHPRFETIFKVLNAMGIQMTLVPKVKFRKRRKQTELCVAEKRARYRV